MITKLHMNFISFFQVKKSWTQNLTLKTDHFWRNKFDQNFFKATFLNNPNQNSSRT